MSTTDRPSGSAREEARARATALIQDLARERQALRRELATARRAIESAVGAAVEALEILHGTAVASAAGDEQGAALAIAWAAARDRLSVAGIVLDGEIGEAVDLSRHRVVQQRAAPGREGRVLEVVSPGVLFAGRRLREAVVIAAD